MPRVALWRRRELPVPTIWGCMLILLFAVAVSVFIVRNIYSFLALEKPAGASVLVVEGWITPEDLDQSLALIRSNNYRRVITTGGPLLNAPAFKAPSTYAVLARDYLISKGVPAASITAIPSPRSARDRTYLSAVLVRDSLGQAGQPIDTIDVFSAAVHSRRTQLLYQMAFGPSVKIGIFAAKPVDYDPTAWWKTSAGAKIVILEAISWTWTVLFFSQPPRGSREEKWGGPAVSAPAG